MPIIKMIQSNLAKLKFPEPGHNRTEWVDQDTPGLYLLATANGKVSSFFLRMKVNKVLKHFWLCHLTPETSLAETRKLAAARRAAVVANGADPIEKPTVQKEATTLISLYRDYYEDYIIPRKRSWRSDESMFRLHISSEPFANKPLSMVTRQEIAAWHAGLLTKTLSPASADNCLKLLKHMIFLSIDWGLLDSKNPAARIPLFNVDNRVTNHLSDQDLERLLTVLRTDANRPVCLIALFLLSTGARLSEALQAMWIHIDKENRRWHVPMTNSKSKRSRWIPLTDSAMLVLQEIGTEEYSHVFTNRRTGKRYTNITKQVKRLYRKASLPSFRTHDLRHNFASLLAEGNCSLAEIGELLGHSRNSGAITRRYIHFSQGTLHKSADLASRRILGTGTLASKTEAANTVLAVTEGELQEAA